MIVLPFTIPIFNETRRHLTIAIVVAVAAFALWAAAVGTLSFFRSPKPTGWLLHLTSHEAAAAITANQQPGQVHLATAGGRSSIHLLIPAAHPFKRRLCFFSRNPPPHWRRFNLKQPRCAVAIWVHPDDISAIDNCFYRRRLDGAIAWPAADYHGPAHVETADLDQLARHFGPRHQAGDR